MAVDRVQTLFHSGLKALPPQFIRPAHERPENTVAAEGVGVPIISLSQPHDILVNEVYRASEEWGFFLIIDHGIPSSLIQRLKEVGQEFFGLAQDEKESYANDPKNGKIEGYGTKITNNEKLEWIDYFFHLLAPASRVNYDFWPKNPPSYRKVTEEYKEEMVRIGDQLLKLLSSGLGMEENALKSQLGGEEIELEMKINMYPPCPQPQLALGVEPHTDMSALTILASNHVPGLQIWKDDNWVAVNYFPNNALFIHIGDQLEVLSNGKYKSVLHRSLVNKEEMRMSWAVFIAPPNEAVIGPLAQLVDHQNPAKYATKTFAEFRHKKLSKLPQ